MIVGTDLCFKDCPHDYLVSGALGREGPAPGVGAQLVRLLALNSNRLLVPVKKDYKDCTYHTVVGTYGRYWYGTSQPVCRNDTVPRYKY